MSLITSPFVLFSYATSICMVWGGGVGGDIGKRGYHEKATTTKKKKDNNTDNKKKERE